MGTDESGTARAKTLADLAADMPVSGLVEALGSVLESVKSFVESVLDGLSPMVEALAKAVQIFANRATSDQLAFGRDLYESVLAFLEAVPGGCGVARALRVVLDPILYPGFRHLKLIDAVAACSTPPSRAASPRRLVSRSTRSLRGPSAVLGLHHLPVGAALA